MNTIRISEGNGYQVGIWLTEHVQFMPAHDRPAYFLTLWDAARFCNYLNGGRGDLDFFWRDPVTQDPFGDPV
jgi:hypothetical protein